MLILSLLLMIESSGWSSPLETRDTDLTSEKTYLDRLKDFLGVTYFSFFYGPGVTPETVLMTPNQLGLPDNDGVYFLNQFSLRFKFWKNFAIDLQNRFKIILNNYTGNQDFEAIRWETPRIGVSGKLISSGDWTLVGAINTDFPYFLPPPFTGYQAQQRTVIFDPGMFASLKYEPKKSAWSFVSVVSPRYFFYTDRDAAEPQFMTAGYVSGNKPELIISFQPTVNYRVASNTSLSLGTGIDYRKQVISNWNIFNASLLANGSDPAWRLNAVPLCFGVTYSFGPHLAIFPFISTYPIAAQRVDGQTGRQATLLEVTSIGMWLSGTLF